MAQANCAICSRVEDTRSLALCPSCGQWVCTTCTAENGVCSACDDEEQEEV